MIENINLTRAIHGAGSPLRAVKLPTVRPGEDYQTALRPRVVRAWRKHVRLRDALRAETTSANAAKAEAAFDRLIEVTAATIELPWPRSLEGLGDLVTAVAMAHDGRCLDDADPAHRALKRLLSGCFIALKLDPPDGHAGL